MTEMIHIDYGLLYTQDGQWFLLWTSRTFDAQRHGVVALSTEDVRAVYAIALLGDCYTVRQNDKTLVIDKRSQIGLCRNE